MGDLIELAKTLKFDPLLTLFLGGMMYIFWKHSEEDKKREGGFTKALNAVALALERLSTVAENQEKRLDRSEERLDQQIG